jgi:hypothetical protein
VRWSSSVSTASVREPDLTSGKGSGSVTLAVRMRSPRDHKRRLFIHGLWRLLAPKLLAGDGGPAAPQHVLLDLAGGRLRQLVNNVEVSGRLEVRQMIAGELA